MTAPGPVQRPAVTVLRDQAVTAVLKATPAGWTVQMVTMNLGRGAEVRFRLDQPVVDVNGSEAWEVTVHVEVRGVAGKRLPE